MTNNENLSLYNQIDLTGKVALVTGGAQGIGRVICSYLAGSGARVAIADCNEKYGKLAAQELGKYGSNAAFYYCDVSDESRVKQLVDELVNAEGGIDILVNNAGITRDNLLMRMNEQDWDLVIKVNLKSVFNLTKAVQRVMLKQRSGSIINMSSVVGVGGNAGQSNYAASKAGLIGFTKSIAQELGSRSIRCNAIAPGFIETAMTAKLSEEVRNNWINSIPLRRGGTPEDVADVALFLASDLSSYVTGQVISVCGGMQM